VTRLLSTDVLTAGDRTTWVVTETLRKVYDAL
jgi:uncharacterized cupin superfamily protein